jgi:hypothetical protein
MIAIENVRVTISKSIEFTRKPHHSTEQIQYSRPPNHNLFREIDIPTVLAANTRSHRAHKTPNCTAAPSKKALARASPKQGSSQKNAIQSEM